ncbi:MAG: DsrE family protein [Proteobacteria bacterium]|nr:DsrE family protein [Desulfocapsa sp.]MBU3946540.1 DsrE family protein [Pseudomonadota bacterium]MCG2745330.1 DsrE family protein [Desulfobacteraceae bacterium]MBU3982381.1 DsrE family protein [Pseudomonadota bacterium]MBU4028406.1 DsrE family protein [Pseudomonadota bacterium]
MLVRYLMPILLFMLICSSSLHAAQKPAANEALAELETAKVVFDVRLADLDSLIFNLKLLDETWKGIAAQDVKPEMIVAFRGPTVKLLTSAELDEEALHLFRVLKKKGVRFEACGVAMRIFKVAPAGLTPEVKLVANVFNSLIGYQSKNYAMIVIN